MVSVRFHCREETFEMNTIRSFLNVSVFVVGEADCESYVPKPVVIIGSVELKIFEFVKYEGTQSTIQFRCLSKLSKYFNLICSKLTISLYNGSSFSIKRILFKTSELFHLGYSDLG